jgi:repressor LexA
MGRRSPHPMSPNEARAFRAIRNQIMHRGRSPSVRELASVLGYRSPRSAAILIDRLVELGYAARGPDGRLRLLQLPRDDESHARTVEVPLVGAAPCGAPLLAEENLEAVVPVSVRLARPPHRYFLLRARGDSMTERGIEDGSLVLVRQQSTAENGEVVVALIDDEATIKELRRSGDVVALTPRTKNPVHKPIILDRDFLVQGVVVAALPDVDQ